MYFKKAKNENGCECNHDYAMHGKLNKNDDGEDDDDVLAEDIVLLSKFKDEIKQFDQRSAKVNDWFDRNRYLKIKREETLDILSKIKLKKNLIEKNSSPSKRRKSIKPKVQTRINRRRLSSDTHTTFDDDEHLVEDSIESLSPRDLKLKKLLSPRLEKEKVTRTETCAVCDHKFKELSNVASKWHITAVKKYINDPPKTKAERRRRRKNRVIIPQPFPVKPNRLKGPWQYWMQRDPICVLCSQFFENKEFTSGTTTVKELSGSSSKTWIKLAGMNKPGKANKVKRFATKLNKRVWRKPYTPKLHLKTKTSEKEDDDEYEYGSSSSSSGSNDSKPYDDSGSEKEEDLTLEERLYDAEAEQTFLKKEIAKYKALKETINTKKKMLEKKRKKKDEENFKHFLQRQRDFWCDKNAELSKMSEWMEDV